MVPSQTQLLREVASRVEEIELRIDGMDPQLAASDADIRGITGFSYKKGDNKADFNGVITRQTLNFAKEMLDDMEGHDKVHITVNSPGGNAITGVALFNLFNNAKQHITMTASGQAYSAAGLMLQGADERLVAPGSYIGVHRSWASAKGNEGDFRKLTMALQKNDENVLDIYASVGKRDKLAQIKAYMQEDTALSGKQAVEVGLADRALTKKEAKKLANSIPDAHATDEETLQMSATDGSTEAILGKIDELYQKLAPQKEASAAEADLEAREKALNEKAAQLLQHAEALTKLKAELEELDDQAAAKEATPAAPEVKNEKEEASPSVKVEVKGVEDVEEFIRQLGISDVEKVKQLSNSIVEAGNLFAEEEIKNEKEEVAAAPARKFTPLVSGLV